jgi:tetratricopeptide (TPR) repeat protein
MNAVSRLLTAVAPVFAGAAVFAAGELDVARQALHDGVWRTAVSSADAAATSATNSSCRSSARLVALEALARLGDDAEMNRRLNEWSEEAGEAFRYWRARSALRSGDLTAAADLLAEPFADASLALPAACLKARLLADSGDKTGALGVLEDFNLSEASSVAEDAALLKGELLDDAGRRAEARAVLTPLVSGASRREVSLRAGFLLGFSELADPGMRTAGAARIRALLRKFPGDGISTAAAKSFADRLLDYGDAEGAADEYRRYAEINPAADTDADTLERRGSALFLLKRHSEAAGFFARAERNAQNLGDKARLAYRQAEALLAAGRYADAAAAFGRSAGFGGPDDRRALFAQADALERAGDSASAGRIHEELASGDDNWALKSRLRLTAATAAKGRLAEAIDGYGKILQATNLLSAADIVEARLGRGRACYRDYRFKDAAADFAAVGESDPAQADGMRFLSVLCLYGEGRDSEAKAAARELMKAATNRSLRAELVLWCAKLEYNQGEYASARRYFEEYASLAPSGPRRAAEAYLWAARCAAALNEYSKAVELATKAASLSDSDAFFADALIVQGEALMEQGRYAEAVMVFDRSAAKSGGTGPDAAKAQALRADALYAMGAGDQRRYEDAIAAYRELPEGSALSDDRKMETAFKIGRALEKLRRTGEAMDQYYKNVVLAYQAGVNRGVLYGTPARTFFSRAAFALAEYLGGAGDWEGAVNVLERVRAAEVPASEEAARRIEELKKGGRK